jgi:hypothetical protein
MRVCDRCRETRPDITQVSIALIDERQEITRFPSINEPAIDACRDCREIIMSAAIGAAFPPPEVRAAKPESAS